ncbi:MAG: HAD family hydrolase [Siculibacillus sp.]|nr:HAD family hydrolase [Siculibacillus sp.]
MSGPRAILFDKDGTLLDYWASWGSVNRAAVKLAAAGDAALASRLFEVGGVDENGSAASAHSLLAAGSAHDIARVWVAAGARFTVPELTRALDDLFRASVGDMVPVGDLPAILGGLAARGLGLGIASSDGEAAIRDTVVRFGLTDLVDFVCGWDSGHGPKPEPGMVHAFCRAVGVAPAEVVMVGDTLHDIEMGRAAGCGLVVGVLTGTGTREVLGGVADLVLDGIADLEAALFN